MTCQLIKKHIFIELVGVVDLERKGVSISMVKMNDSNEVRILNKMKNYYNIDINELPEDIEHIFNILYNI